MALRHHVRVAVFERDSYRCRYCGVRYVNKQTREPVASYFDNAPAYLGGPRWRGLLHVDHIIPRCKGGTDDPENLVTACERCNLEKYDNIWTPRPLEAVA